MKRVLAGIDLHCTSKIPRKKKHDLRSVKSKPSEVISNYFRDPKKMIRHYGLKLYVGLLIALLNRCISIHSSELRTHWNICRYNNIPDIHII